jgi:hypothetical protein
MASRTALALALASTLLVPACGGGGDGNGGPSGGVFLDSAVEGLAWTSGALSGTTDAEGSFSIDGNNTAVFSLGGIELGFAPPESVVTPVDLVAGAADETHPTVTNIARFLQTLDTDLDPSNGITIDPSVAAAAVGQALDFEQSIANFAANAQSVVDTLTAGLPGGSRPLIPAVDAQQHLAGTLIGGVAGLYEGTFSGTDAGEFAVYIDRSGALHGAALTQFDELLGLTGDASSDGGFLAGDVSSGATFTGSISASGVLSGTWALPPSDAGTFVGVRVEGVDPTVDHDLIEALTGVYVGTTTSGMAVEPVEVTMDGGGNFSVDGKVALGGTVVTTDQGVIVFAGLDVEGTAVAGEIDAKGAMTGTFSNPIDGESGTFAAALQP